MNRLIPMIKQLIRVHYGSLFIITVQMIALMFVVWFGSQVLTGKVVNPFSPNETTGLALIAVGVGAFSGNLFWWNLIYESESQQWRRKHES